MKYFRQTLRKMLLILCAAGTPTAWAQTDSWVQFSGSGFLTIAAGKVLNSGAKEDPDNPSAARQNGYHCPCFITDYAHNSVYESSSRIDFAPDSKLGLQGTAAFGDKFSLTGQTVFRGSQQGKPNLEWVYGTYNLNSKFSVQFGRKRLPILAYSESQDVGLSFPWVHLGSDTYGWEVVNYNGVNVLYKDQFGRWSSTVNVLTGSETINDNKISKLYYGKDSTSDSRWSAIAGLEVLLSKDWLELRGAYIQSDTQYKLVKEQSGARTDADWSDKKKQKIYSGGVSIDYQNWVARAEAVYADRKANNETDRSKTLGVGYTFGKYLPMLTVGDFIYSRPSGNYSSTLNGGPGGAEGFRQYALSLRYDLTDASDLKAQIERWRDHSRGDKSDRSFWLPSQFNNATLFSVSYDLTF